MQRRILAINVVLLVVLICTTSWQVARGMSQIEATQTDPDQVAAVRSLYQDFNTWMNGDDESPLLESLASGSVSFAPTDGLLKGQDGLSETMLALRQTCPGFAAIPQSIHPANGIVFADVAISGGQGDCLSQSALDVEQFAGDGLSRFSSSYEFPMLDYQLPWYSPEPTSGNALRTLAAIQLVLWPGAKAVLTPYAGSLLLVTGGELTISATGSLDLADIYGTTTKPVPALEKLQIKPGQAITNIFSTQAQLRNDGKEAVHLLLFTSITPRSSSERHSETHSTIEDAYWGQVGIDKVVDDTVVTVLARSTDSLGWGELTYLMQWHILPAGATLKPLHTTSHQISIDLSGQSVIAGNGLVTNPAESPALIMTWSAGNSIQSEVGPQE